VVGEGESIGLNRDVPTTGDGTRWWFGFISSGSSVDRKPGNSVLNVDAEMGGDGDVGVDVDVGVEVEGPATGDMSVASPELTKRDIARVSDEQSRPSVVGEIKRNEARVAVVAAWMIGDEEVVAESYSVVRPMSFRANCTTKRTGTARPHAKTPDHDHAST
jgi:hypothetical protein